MVEEVEDSHAYSRAQVLLSKGQRNRARDLEVERRKKWETIDVPRSNIFAEFVFNGVGKSGMQVVDRNKRYFPRRGERAPEQEAVGRVKQQSPAGIRLDDRLREIPKELIEIVEIAKGPGSDILSVQHMVTHLVAGRQLEFPVRIAAAV